MGPDRWWSIWWRNMPKIVAESSFKTLAIVAFCHIATRWTIRDKKFGHRKLCWCRRHIWSPNIKGVGSSKHDNIMILPTFFPGRWSSNFIRPPYWQNPVPFSKWSNLGLRTKNKAILSQRRKKRRPEIPYLGITADVVVVTYVYLIAVLGVCNRIFSPEKKVPYKLKFL